VSYFDDGAPIPCRIVRTVTRSHREYAQATLSAWLRIRAVEQFDIALTR
jgi:hypothetical protein